MKRHLKALGKLRDAQVQRMFLEEQTTRFPDVVEMTEFLRKRERKLVKRTARKLHKFKSHDLKQYVSDMREELECWPDDPRKQLKLSREVLAAVSNAFTKVVCCRQAIDPREPQTVHQTRVAFKKFRYMVEALSPDFTHLGKKQLRCLGNYQRRMGNLQDFEILQTCTSRFLEEQKKDKQISAAFLRRLRALHASTLRSCLKHADDLFAFWVAQNTSESSHLKKQPGNQRRFGI